MTDDQLPTARVLPRDPAERLAILRGQASAGVRRAGRVGLALTKGLSLLALCGAGVGLTRAVLRPSHVEIDLRRLDLPRLDHELQRTNQLELRRLRAGVERDLYRRLHAPFHEPELVSEPVHQTR